MSDIPLPTEEQEPQSESSEISKTLALLIKEQAEELSDEKETTIIIRTPKPQVDTYGTTPLEDRYGRSRWVITKHCWCSSKAETDCRFHSRKEPGWETCPSKPHPDADESTGRKLWATHPRFGLPPVEEEGEIYRRWASVKLKDADAPSVSATGDVVTVADAQSSARELAESNPSE